MGEVTQSIAVTRSGANVGQIGELKLQTQGEGLAKGMVNDANRDEPILRLSHSVA